MAKTNEYNFWIDKICDCKVFTSSSDVRLFRYLAEATLNNSILKETVIAMEVFNRDPTFNPSDNSLVRSSIYNLRKKLDAYYLSEGKDDTIRISIPKGSYHLDFQEIQIEKPFKVIIADKKRGTIYPILVVLLFVTTTLFGFLYFSVRENFLNIRSNNHNNFFWSDFIKSQKPLLIVLGDYFLMENNPSSDSSRNFVLNLKVNSPEDFIAFRNGNPEMKDQFMPLWMNYFGEEIPWCLMKIMEVFRGTSKKIELKHATALLPVDLREKDIIFIGDFSTLGLLKGFFEKTHYKVSASPPTIGYGEEKRHFTETMSLVNKSGSVFQNDYSIVAKITGYSSNQMMFFLSFLPFGKTEAINKLTDPEFIAEIEKLTDKRPKQWDLLLKVSGLRTSGFYYETLRFKEIKP